MNKPTTLSMAIAAILYAGFASRDAIADPRDSLLTEIVVTARKRSENLQDVPQNIDVFTAKDLHNLGIVKLEDYAALSPSISLISTGPSQQRIFIRGASDGSNPNYGSGNISTTGFLLDDISFSYYGHDPDLHLYDIERIEILNGPQGTLFGPGSLSGAVRVIAKKPDPGAFSAGVSFDGGRYGGGGGDNWTYEGFANIPLVDGKTALRVSAYSVREGGYIDNVLGTRNWLNGVTSTNADWAGRNQNTRDILGGRVALQHNLSDDWRVILTGYYQQQRYRGAWDDDPTYVGNYQLRRFSPQGGYDYDRFLDLHVEGDVGIGDLIYAGGFSVQQKRRLYDFSEYTQYIGFANQIQAFTCATDPGSGPGDHGCGVPYMYGAVGGKIERWSNELRLASKPGGRTHWTVGAYWEKTRNPGSGFQHLPNVKFNGEPAQSIIASYGNLAQPLAEEFYSNYFTSRYLQTTEFGDLTVDLSARWNVEAGVEHFHSSNSEYDDWAGNFWIPKTPAAYSGSSDKTNFKAGVNYKPSAHALLYFSYAQGFRDGGFNYVPVNYPDPTVPRSFHPDTLNNYELGWKTDFLHGHLRWNGAVYYMPWKGYQINVSLPVAPFAFQANIGDARIAGVESTVEIRPLDGLQVSVAGNYNDATLRSDAFQRPDFLVVPGERLPEAPELNWSAVVRYEHALLTLVRGYTQVDIAHKGGMWNDVRLDHRVWQPPYTLFNLRLGLAQADGHWQAEAYATNLANKRAVVFADQTGYASYQGHSQPVIPTAPRAYGIRLSYNWGK